MSWTAHADLAEAAAIALTDEGRLDGITPPLAAGATLTDVDRDGVTVADRINNQALRNALAAGQLAPADHPLMPAGPSGTPSPRGVSQHGRDD